MLFHGTKQRRERGKDKTGTKLTCKQRCGIGFGGSRRYIDTPTVRGVRGGGSFSSRVGDVALM